MSRSRGRPMGRSMDPHGRWWTPLRRRGVLRTRFVALVAFVVVGVICLVVGSRLMLGIGVSLVMIGLINLLVLVVSLRTEYRMAVTGEAAPTSLPRHASRGAIALALVGAAAIVIGGVLGTGPAYNATVATGEFLVLIGIFVLMAGLLVIIWTKQRRPGDRVPAQPDGQTIVIGDRRRIIGVVYTVLGLLAGPLLSAVLVNQIMNRSADPQPTGALVGTGLCALAFMAMLVVGLAFLFGVLHTPRIEIDSHQIRCLSVRSRARVAVVRDHLGSVVFDVRRSGGRSRRHMTFHGRDHAEIATCPIPGNCATTLVRDALVQAGVPVRTS